MNKLKRIEFLVLTAGFFLAVFVSPFASPWPDGLEKTAADQGFLEREASGNYFIAPMPDYRMPGVKNDRVAASLAGFAGALTVYVLVLGAGILIRRIKKKS